MSPKNPPSEAVIKAAYSQSGTEQERQEWISRFAGYTDTEQQAMLDSYFRRKFEILARAAAEICKPEPKMFSKKWWRNLLQ